jgi:type VI secretion system protein ImpC
MHHPDFEQLEGAWRGLRYLVSQTETGELLKIRVLNVAKRELQADFEQAGELEDSALYCKVYAEEYCQLGGEPYGLLVGDYQFSVSEEDVSLLKKISHVAAAAHAVFVASASLKVFGVDIIPVDMIFRVQPALFDRPEYAAWNSFRECEDSRYVALTLPRVLSRAPYVVEKELSFEEIRFDEYPLGGWMSSAWAHAVRVTNAFARHGWMMRIRGHVAGGKVEGLPVPFFYNVGADCLPEITITERRALEMSRLGFLPLHQDWDNTGQCFFMSAHSCHKPPQYADAAANADAEWSAQVNLLLCASRFMHYLKIMVRDRIGPMTSADCERWLNEWIRNFCVDPEGTTQALQAQRPLTDARIEVRPMPGKPGRYELTAYLRPHYQLEDLHRAMRLVAELPRLG